MKNNQKRYPQLRDKAWLSYQYETLKKGIHVIAGELGCRPSTVIYAMRCHNIQARRDKGGAPRGACSREKSPRWKGGRLRRGDGYIYVLVGHDYPGADKRGYIAEHRMVMQQVLGRRLAPNEHVHHINGKKDDNRSENLYLLSPSFHAICKKCPLKQEVEHLRSRLREISKINHLKLHI